VSTARAKHRLPLTDRWAGRAANLSAIVSARKRSLESLAMSTKWREMIYGSRTRVQIRADGAVEAVREAHATALKTSRLLKKSLASMILS
jgi:hypothetical protein